MSAPQEYPYGVWLALSPTSYPPAGEEALIGGRDKDGDEYIVLGYTSFRESILGKVPIGLAGTHAHADTTGATHWMRIPPLPAPPEAT